MKKRWQLREAYFNGANTYKLAVRKRDEENIIGIEVDAAGYFELDAPDGFYVFAKLAPSAH